MKIGSSFMFSSKKKAQNAKLIVSIAIILIVLVLVLIMTNGFNSISHQLVSEGNNILSNKLLG